MKKFQPLIALLLCTAVLAGCQKAPETAAPSSSEAAVPKATASSASVVEEAPATGKVIEPLPATLDISALSDCTFAAGFLSSAVAKNADGSLSITMTVYDCDLFDLVDISLLAPGDTIVIEEESVVVTSVENGDNRVLINGGVDQGGWELSTDETGVYFPTVWDSGPLYHPLGEVTLPVSPDFVYTDCSDLDKPEVQYSAEEFWAQMQTGSAEFVPQGTTVCVEGGQITGLTQKYTP